MIEIKGKYCKDVKIFTDNIESEALSLIYEISENPSFKEQKIRIMPDVHAGKGITIGFSSTLGEFVNPSHVGCDIGCTISTMLLNKKINEDDYALFEHRVRKAIPTGFDIQSKTVFNEKEFFKFLRSQYTHACSTWGGMIEMPTINEKWLSDTLKRLRMDEGTFYKSVATLGGGNHFIEYGETKNGKSAFSIHSGSRNFGLKVFKYWDTISKRTPRNSSIFNLDEKIKEIKATVSDRKQWKNLIAEAKEYAKTCNPQGYLSGDNLKGYLNDMVLAQAYAKWNHITMHKLVSDILLKFNVKCDEIIFTTHNYIDFSDKIIRKGAVRAYEGEKFILPFNMRDGIAICEGKSNEDWNFTAPHGAGRIMSRAKAKSTLSLDDYKETMKGVYSTCVTKGTIDEAPMAYKDTQEIISLIEPTCTIIDFYSPKINIKATE